MPQLKKVVLAVGNRLIYADTYDEALAQLSGGGWFPHGSPPDPIAAAPLRTRPRGAGLPLS